MGSRLLGGDVPVPGAEQQAEQELEGTGQGVVERAIQEGTSGREGAKAGGKEGRAKSGLSEQGVMLLVMHTEMLGQKHGV
jgi:hypothetical protein